MKSIRNIKVTGLYSITIKSRYSEKLCRTVSFISQLSTCDKDNKQGKYAYSPTHIS